MADETEQVIEDKKYIIYTNGRVDMFYEGKNPAEVAIAPNQTYIEVEEFPDIDAMPSDYDIGENGTLTKNQVYIDARLTRTWAIRRREAYPSVGDQLDDLFKAGAFSDDMAARIQAVKDSIAKPDDE